MRTLTLSYSTSRGRETYGYNIVRLDDSSTGKRFRCMGGGYDMTGTVLGEWLTAEFQSELKSIAGRAYYNWSDGSNSTNENGLYGLSRIGDRMSVDGAAGVDSVIRIAETIGVRLDRMHKRGNTIGWAVVATPNGAPE